MRSLNADSGILSIMGGLQLNEIIVFSIIPQKQQIVKFCVTELVLIDLIGYSRFIELRGCLYGERLAHQTYDFRTHNVFVHYAFDVHGLVKVACSFNSNAYFCNSTFFVFGFVSECL